MGHRDGEKEGVMPKEVIYTQSTPYMPVVVWDRGQDMRIGLIVSDSTLVEALFGSQAEQIGAACRDLPFPIVSRDDTNITDERLGAAIVGAIAGVSPFESLWADLDRSECNSLVRVLRRARNQVFGVDE